MLTRAAVDVNPLQQMRRSLSTPVLLKKNPLGSSGVVMPSSGGIVYSGSTDEIDTVFHGASVGQPVTDIKEHLKTELPRIEFMTIEISDTNGRTDIMIEAQKAWNREKNRYVNILPWDHSRVKLAAIEGEEGSDYINANFIHGEVAGSEKAYIATQGPLPHTRKDFWRMVWENTSSIIVMLGKDKENNRIKVDRYWPEVGEPVMYAGDFSVALISKESALCDSAIITRKLQLTNLRTSGTRLITHYQYEGWPDHGVPTCTYPIRQLVNMVEESRQASATTTTTTTSPTGPSSEPTSPASRDTHTPSPPDTDTDTYPDIDSDSSSPSSIRSNSNSKPPIVVHCSAGVGRTGAFVTIHLTIEKIQHLVRSCPSAPVLEFNIYNTVQRLRQQRPGMVQQQEQYLFCYEAIAEEAERLGVLSHHRRRTPSNDTDCSDSLSSSCDGSDLLGSEISSLGSSASGLCTSGSEPSSNGSSSCSSEDETPI
eukprot:TRINITY_DN1701_c0_g1_i1.p1 TRINITY_DN1701_c0_g1~~TRINITY_DN1701_c0_g1_i1.p1  ORF type:complete len:482 (+),score=60.55 TRINITY_DN1701_c0_g1_i1:133-1578(+)